MSAIGRCRSCGADVIFLPQPSGKRPPYNVKLDENKRLVPDLNARGDPISHFATCVDAARWKGKAR